ncbi:phage holin family protein [Geminicoccus harenae]|uniref:phage holin family protein n=1 Tax=Geminicoccus harenae TaxID=2498453 RepID=UPI00168B7B6F|nr:phage holin family protein [Geminicoccus harenae]
MMQDRPITSLFSDLIENVTTLFRKEVQLAKAELSEKAGQVGTASASVGVGGVILLGAFIMLLHAIVAWLAVAGLGTHWGFLIVAIVVGIIGYVALQKGINNLKAARLMPTKTVEQLQRDAAVAREQVR